MRNNNSIRSNPVASASNPFRAVSSSDAFEDATEGSYEYRLVAAQALGDANLESTTDEVAVRICWGRTLLHTAQVAQSGAFTMGEPEAGAHVDFVAPSSQAGATRVQVVLTGGRVALTDPTAVLQLAGTSMTIEAAVAAGLAEATSEAGVPCVRLTEGSSVSMALGELTVELRGVKGGKKAVTPFSLRRLGGGALPHIFVSFLAVVGLLGAVRLLSPPMNGTDEDTLSDAQRYFIQMKLDSAAEREQDETETPLLNDSDTPDSVGGSGVASKGAAGSMGKTTATATNGRYAIAGDGEDPHLARAAALQEAASFGMVSVLAGGDINAPTAPWGRDSRNGSDPLSANGNMWGPEIGDSYGAGGLSLTGIGEGGGGRGEGVGLGTIGTINNGAGNGDGDGIGDGTSRGRLRRSRRAKAPTIRMTGTNVSGRIPAQVIQRIVRANYGRFRACYESGLRTNPNLQGRVAVNFVIGRDGRVSNVSGGGDMPDSGVISCIARSFYSLTFPQPDSGIVTVTYPLMMTPAG